MKIVVLDGYSANPGDLSWEHFERLGPCRIYDRTPPDLIAERIGDAEAVITNKAPITEETLVACEQVKYIGVIATGYNVVDIAAAKKRGIVVTNIPSYTTDGVAQLTFALLLEVCNHIALHSESVKRGEWSVCEDFSYTVMPQKGIAGKTIGLIGFGEIGKAVAGIASAFRMNVIASTPSKTSGRIDAAELVTLDELFKRSDILSLHCRLTDDNINMINADTIARLKDGVILLNTARGPLVNEHDIADALLSGKVAAYATDVTSREPIPKDSPLLTAKNCIITPHIAWMAQESRMKLLDIAAENVRAFLDGAPIHVIS
jgi:glycerate dehydrogenase